MDDHVGAFLADCRELAAFCTQNGWIDNDSITYEVTPLGRALLDVAVKFDEVVMKGAGCEGRRIPCFARLRLALDERGAVSRVVRD